MLEYQFENEKMYFILIQDGEVFIEDSWNEYWNLEELFENEMILEGNYEDIKDKWRKFNKREIL